MKPKQSKPSAGVHRHPQKGDQSKTSSNKKDGGLQSVLPQLQAGGAPEFDTSQSDLLLESQRLQLMAQYGKIGGNQFLNQQLQKSQTKGSPLSQKKGSAKRHDGVNDLIQREDPESEQQAENIYAEQNFSRITETQQQMIDSLALKAHTLISRWGQLREMHTGGPITLDYDTYITELRRMDRNMSRIFLDFKSDYTRTPTKLTLPERGMMGIAPTTDHHIAFGDHPAAQSELYRQLNSGNFKQYLEEMKTLHGFEVTFIQYSEIFEEYGGLDVNPKPNHYDLITIFGIEGGAGEVVTGGLNFKGFTISYENDLGMKWKVDTWGGAGRLGAGVSLSPVELNVESSMGSTQINAGSAEEYKYYPPNYFNWNLVTLAGGSAVLGGGYAVSTMSIGDVDFDTSGIVVKAGTADVGEAGIEVGLGVSRGGDPYDIEGLGDAEKEAVEPKSGNWISIIGGKLYFKSSENELDDDDLAVIEKIAAGIQNHENHFPGDIFKIAVLGTATERWLHPNHSGAEQGVDFSDIHSDQEKSKEEKGAAKAARLNQKLALERAHVTFNTLVDQIKGLKLTPGILDSVEWQVNAKIMDAEDELVSDNAPENRGAIIQIYYLNTLSPEGNVNQDK